MNSYLGNKVREIRQSKGLSQTVFGEKIGLTQKGVSKIERGNVAQPRAIKKIAAIGKISVAELLEPSRKNKTPKKKEALSAAGIAALQDLDDEQLNEVADFADFLRNRQSKK